MRGKRLILIGVVLLVLVGLGGGVLMLGPRLLPGLIRVQLGGSGDPSSQADGTSTAATPAVETGVPVTLGERVVNLADPGGFRYLKTEIVLSLSDPAVPSADLTGDKLKEEQSRLNLEIDPIRPQIQDVLTTVLTSKTVADVSTPQGKEALKQELLAQLQPLLGQQRILGIYFAQFLIQ